MQPSACPPWQPEHAANAAQELRSYTTRWGTILLETHFNEFYVVAQASYDGALLPLPTRRPSFEEIADSPDGAQRLAGLMIRQHADNVRAGRRGELSIVDLRFDH
jgi:hypothetical protein